LFFRYLGFCSNATKSGIVDYIFDNKPKYLLLDEHKLSRKDQTFLLNLIETGIVSEIKYKKTRSIEIKHLFLLQVTMLKRLFLRHNLDSLL
jgi:hypothetical protein